MNLNSESDDLNQIENLTNRLSTKIIGNQIKYYPEITSTNDEARRLAEGGVREGIVVIAGAQKEGRGRRGRFWESPAGGIWLTIILRPKIAPENAPLLTLLTGVIIAEIVRDKYHLEAYLKWPNDVRIDGKKVCGILTELSTFQDKINYILIGVGINANNPSELFPIDLKPVVTSLVESIGHDVDRIQLIKEFLNRFEQKYTNLKEIGSKGYGDIIASWRQLSDTLGRQVKIETLTGSISGFAEDIADNGALIIVTADGEKQKVLAGDCLYSDL